MKTLFLLVGWVAWLSLCEAWSIREWRNKLVDRVAEAMEEGDFDAYNKAVETAAKDLEEIDVGSAKRFKDVVFGTTGLDPSKVVNEVVDKVEILSKGLVNGGVDLLLEQVRGSVTGENPLPDVSASSRTFSVTATGGHFGDLTHLTRTGDFNLTREGASLVVDIPLTVSDLKVGYQSYAASAFMIKAKGKIEASVSSNKASLRIRFSPLSGCLVAVEDFKLESLEGVEVTTTSDCRICGVTVSQTKSTITEKMQGEIKNSMEQEMKTVISKAVGEKGLLTCSKILINT